MHITVGTRFSGHENTEVTRETEHVVHGAHTYTYTYPHFAIVETSLTCIPNPVHAGSSHAEIPPPPPPPLSLTYSYRVYIASCMNQILIGCHRSLEPLCGVMLFITESPVLCLGLELEEWSEYQLNVFSYSPNWCTYCIVWVMSTPTCHRRCLIGNVVH